LVKNDRLITAAAKCWIIELLERERERERQRHTHTHTHTPTGLLFIYLDNGSLAACQLAGEIKAVTEHTFLI
jgi:hypothetical protein